jgi:Tfp pilus assembly protein PilO
MEKYILQLGELTWSKVIFGGIIAAVLYWSLYYDDGATLEASILALQTQYTEAEKNLQETRQAMADTEKFEKEVRNNEIQFEKVLEYLPQEMNSNELTRMINEIVAQTGTRLLETKPQLNVERKEFYEITRIDLNIEGRFVGVVTFLSALSRVPKLLTFDKIEVLVSSKPGAGSLDDAPNVQLSGTLLGYRYLKDVEPGSAISAAGASAPTSGGPSGTTP